MENKQLMLPLNGKILKRYEVFIEQLRTLKKDKIIDSYNIINTLGESVYCVCITIDPGTLYATFDISLKQTLVSAKTNNRLFYFSPYYTVLKEFIENLIVSHKKGFLVEEKVLSLFKKFSITHKEYLNEVNKASEYDDHVKKVDLMLKINHLLPEASLRFVVGVQIKSSITGQNKHKNRHPLVPSFVYDEAESEEDSFLRIKKLIVQIGELKKNEFVKNQFNISKKNLDMLIQHGRLKIHV